MDTYVGLDVSLRETAVCVVDELGAIQLEQTVAADPDVIAALLQAQAPTMRRVGLESGPTSVWLWRELAKRGLPVICIDARHAKAALSMQINKSDRNDAAGIARIMQTGWHRQVQIKSPHSHAIRVPHWATRPGADAYVLQVRSGRKVFLLGRQSSSGSHRKLKCHGAASRPL